MKSAFYFLAVIDSVTISYGAPAVSQAPPINLWPEGKVPGLGAKGLEKKVAKKDPFQRITNVSLSH